MPRLQLSDTSASQAQNSSDELEAVAKEFATHPDFAEARADSLLWDAALPGGATVLQTEAFLAERSARAGLAAFDKLMERKSGEPPRVGDEIADEMPTL